MASNDTHPINRSVWIDATVGELIYTYICEFDGESQNVLNYCSRRKM